MRKGRGQSCLAEDKPGSLPGAIQRCLELRIRQGPDGNGASRVLGLEREKAAAEVGKL